MMWKLGIILTRFLLRSAHEPLWSGSRQTTTRHRSASLRLPSRAPKKRRWRTDPKKHAAMHVDQGKQQLRQGFYEEARDNFREALSLDSSNTEAHIGLASAQIALNDLAGAR